MPARSSPPSSRSALAALLPRVWHRFLEVFASFEAEAVQGVALCGGDTFFLSQSNGSKLPGSLGLTRRTPIATPPTAVPSPIWAGLSQARSGSRSRRSRRRSLIFWLGQSDKDFEAAAFDLAAPCHGRLPEVRLKLTCCQVGAISDIVISQRGAHLIHRLA